MPLHRILGTLVHVIDNNINAENFNFYSIEAMVFNTFSFYGHGVNCVLETISGHHRYVPNEEILEEL